MLEFPGFTNDDFDVFAIPILEGRMDGIKAGPRPKLLALGRDLAPELTRLTGQEMFPIVAQHARRKVNPPKDTWVAWSANKRGYKMLPHFQVGMWETHAFIQAGVIYEAQGRAPFADNLLAKMGQIRSIIPGHYRWMEDYTKPDGILHRDMTREDFERIAQRLKNRKEADAMVGLSVDRAAVAAAGPAFAQTCLEVMRTILPIYQMANAGVAVSVS